MRLTYITRVKARQPVLFIISKVTRPYQYFVFMVNTMRIVRIGRCDFFICVQYYSLDRIAASKYKSIYYDKKDGYGIGELIKSVEDYERSIRNKRNHRIRKQNSRK